MGCLDHPHFSIMLNGASKGFFSLFRGICQRDPSSLFLFTLVADSFSALMSKALSNSLIEEFWIRRDGVQVSHLQFADDTICFIKDSEEPVANLKYIFSIFETISGLKVNYAKSILLGIGVEEEVVHRYASVMACQVEKWSMKYLGMPLGGNKKSSTFWDPVVERVNKKLSCWKQSCISLGGRITLIKATMFNILVYYMSLFKMHVKVMKMIERCRKGFSMGRR